MKNYTDEYYIDENGIELPSHADEQYIKCDKRFKDLEEGDIIYSLNIYTGVVRVYAVDKIKIDEQLTYVDTLDYPLKGGVVWMKLLKNHHTYYTHFKNVWWSYDYAEDALQGFDIVFYCTSKEALFKYIEEQEKFNINYIKKQIEEYD